VTPHNFKRRKNKIKEIVRVREATERDKWRLSVLNVTLKRQQEKRDKLAKKLRALSTNCVIKHDCSISYEVWKVLAKEYNIEEAQDVEGGDLYGAIAESKEKLRV
jgi:hypothetical protein